MTESQPYPDFIQIVPDDAKSSADSIENLSRFKYNAMATTFEILICHSDRDYAAQAAWAAFAELEKLEQALSRYVENSDISRINALEMNRTLKLGLEAFECLEIAAQVYTQTGGAFDVTVGSLFDCWLDKDKNLKSPSPEQIDRARKRTGMHLLKLDRSNFTIRVLADSVRLDLGGIGKGFAVDKMAELLGEWDIESALIHGGASSAVALAPPAGKKGWPVNLSSPWEPKKKFARLRLSNRALNASGLLKGRHIIDPRSGRPVKGDLAAWLSTPTAAIGDALSTAFVVMSPRQIEQYCLKHSDTMAFVVKKQAGGKEKITQFGKWESLY